MTGTPIDHSVPSPDGIESRIARDLARHAALAAPVLVVAVGLWRGFDGALAVGVALAVVVANFLVSAALLGWAARISPTLLMGAALSGFVLRVAAVFGVAVALENVEAIDFPVFVVTVLVAHLGLLFWETRSISLSLASPGLKPKPGQLSR